MNANTDRHHVVVIGAGFGGLQLISSLRGAGVKITLIDQRNHHLFQPLLYQVATTSLATSEIAWPVRHLLRRRKDVTTLLATASGIDKVAKKVLLADGGSVAYDTLVIATGARHAYFGHDEWEPFAPGLKTIEDATAIRRRILLAFERAAAGLGPEAAVAAVLAAMEVLKEAGARRVVQLEVSGAFHSPLLATAAGGLREELEKTDVCTPRSAVIANASAAPVTEPDAIRRSLVEQLTSPVRWEETLRRMVTDGANRFVEIGPGKVLSGLVRAVDRNLEVQAIGTLEQVDATVNGAMEESR